MSQSSNARIANEQEVLGAIDLVKDKLIKCRAYFPYMPPDLLGQRGFETAPLYEASGHSLVFGLSEPLSEEERGRNNAVGHFINQSYVVFLWSILEYYGVVGNIEQTLPYWQHVDILRRLRHVTAHRAGEYDPSIAAHRRMYDKLQELYGLGPECTSERATAFPLSIDQVLLPLTEGCRNYAKAWMARLSGGEL